MIYTTRATQPYKIRDLTELATCRTAHCKIRQKRPSINSFPDDTMTASPELNTAICTAHVTEHYDTY